MTTTYLPDGTATGNADAVRGAPIAQAFQLFANIMQGVDSQPRNEPGMSNSDALLGPSQSFGFDVGVDAQGNLYARGKSGPYQDSSATPADEQPNAANPLAGMHIPPLLLWGGLAFLAYKVLH